jgi:hypothetical protein
MQVIATFEIKLGLSEAGADGPCFIGRRTHLQSTASNVHAAYYIACASVVLHKA